MDNILPRIQIEINNKIFKANPVKTELGIKIIQKSIELISELGFEDFTFKKLAMEIGSTEASVYRYFENKHKLLIYLASWYWSWLEYKLAYSVNNIKRPVDRLKIALKLITQATTYDDNFIHIDEVLLHKIVINESSKSYLTKEVDSDNKEGFFADYKKICKRFAEILKEINPEYKYPTSLSSTIIESAHHQKYFAEHIPFLTDIKTQKHNPGYQFLLDLVLKVVIK